MAVTDIAKRTYDHNFRLDPIVRSLLDTDFYKLLMLQMIRHVHPDVQATFSLINRTRTVRLAEVIDEDELREQLDHARTVRFSKKELIWLAGNSFYGRQRMFAPDFIAWLAEFELPDYELRRVDGQGVQVLLRAVEKEKLALALKGASEDIKDLFFRNLSERAGKMLKDDIEALGPVRVREVDEAQAAIVLTAKDLAAQGQITLSESQDEEMLP